jgi:glycosyltransferase involved in cell wall biosynthesis
MLNKGKFFLVIPAFNEAHRLNAYKYIERLAEIENVAILIVNDGSTDGTSKIVNDLEERGFVSSLTLTENSGKGEAVRTGMIHAMKNNEFEFVGFLDCDGAFPIDSVSSFLQDAFEIFASKPISAVISSRVKLSGRDIKRSSARHYFSRILITIIGLRVLNLPYDSQSGLKIFRKSENLEKALERKFRTRWFFDIELLVRGGWLHHNEVWELPVKAWTEVSGSHLSLRKAPKLILELLIILGRPRG